MTFLKQNYDKVKIGLSQAHREGGMVTLLVLVLLAVGVGVLIYKKNSQKEAERAVVEDTSTSTDTKNTSLANGTFTVVAAESSLTWSAARIVGNSHTGTAPVKDGRVIIENQAFQEGEFVIDMAAVTESENNARFLTHIKSDDFFAVDKFPTAKIVLKSAELRSNNTYLILGDLIIRDITKEISFLVRTNQTDTNLKAEANIEIDRTRWNINFDSGSIFTNLGDHAIRDEVNLKLSLTLAKQESL